MTIQLKRVYDPPSRTDGCRVLVDRLWPRGLTKEKAQIDVWLKDVSPSNDLRKKFKQGNMEWAEFRKAYLAELGANEMVVELALERIPKRSVTFLFVAAVEPGKSHAAVLRDYLKRRLR